MPYDRYNQHRDDRHHGQYGHERLATRKRSTRTLSLAERYVTCSSGAVTKALLLCVLSCGVLAPSLSAADERPRLSDTELIAAARAMLIEAGYPQADTREMTIKPYRADDRRVDVTTGAAIEDGWWTSNRGTTVTVRIANGEVITTFHRLELLAEDIPPPGIIYQGLVTLSHKLTKQSSENLHAVELMRRWFDHNRNNQGRSVDNNLGAYARAHTPPLVLIVCYLPLLITNWN